MVRNVDETFCEGDRLHRTVVCLPGAKIDDVESRIEGLIRSRAEEGMVCIIQVGTNNLHRDSIGQIKEKYKNLFVIQG